MLEIEICVLRKRFRARIRRSSVQQECFQPSMFERLGKTDCIQQLGRFPPLLT